MTASGAGGSELLGKGLYGVVYRSPRTALDAGYRVVDKVGQAYLAEGGSTPEALDVVTRTFLTEAANLELCCGVFNVVQPVGKGVVHEGLKRIISMAEALPSIHEIPSDRRNMKPLEIGTVREVAKGVLHGLSGLERHASLRHLDLKPENLRIGEHTVQLLDLGLSAPLGIPWSVDLSLQKQTPCYRDPRLILGAALSDTQYDMWSLGCTLIELYQGKRLFYYFPHESLSDQVIHLAVMYPVLKRPFPLAMRAQNPSTFDSYIDAATGVPHCICGEDPKLVPLDTILAAVGAKDPLFADLLSQMLTLDSRPLSVDSALEHPALAEIRSFNLKNLPEEVQVEIFLPDSETPVWTVPDRRYYLDPVLFYLPPSPLFKVRTTVDGHVHEETVAIPPDATLAYDREEKCVYFTPRIAETAPKIPLRVVDLGAPVQILPPDLSLKPTP